MYICTDIYTCVLCVCVCSIRTSMSELRRWIKTQSKEVLVSVAAQTAKLDSRILTVPGVVGPEGARGKAGVPGKNGELYIHMYIYIYLSIYIYIYIYIY